MMMSRPAHLRSPPRFGASSAAIAAGPGPRSWQHQARPGGRPFLVLSVL